MVDLWLATTLAAAALWLTVLALPWRPWSTRERLEPVSQPTDERITALIPARDEAAVIATTLRGVLRQPEIRQVVVIDDCSTDATAELVRQFQDPRLELVSGAPLPEGWTGKVWALQQGLDRAREPSVLLLDADIELADGMAAALAQRMHSRGAQLVSVMAALRMEGAWERLLMPAFVFFFKLLYPFRLIDDPRSSVAGAAGGCVLVQRSALTAIGGFHALRDAIIDDCTLAKSIKRQGGATWLGLTRSARSQRRYPSLAAIWSMVARTAYSQLRYSPFLLALCTILMAIAFWIPVAGSIVPDAGARVAALTALGAMVAVYVPTLRYYGLSPVGAILLPVAATLFLAMTWSSAIRHHRGLRSQWKGRSYSVAETSHNQLER